MTDLSDFKRLVYEPEARALRKRIAELEAEVQYERDRLADEQADHDKWAEAEEQRDAYKVQSEPEDSDLTPTEMENVSEHLARIGLADRTVLFVGEVEFVKVAKEQAGGIDPDYAESAE